MAKPVKIVAVALLGLLTAEGAHAQGTGQQPTTGQTQQAPAAQAPAPGGMQGGGTTQGQGMPMMQGQGMPMMQGQGGMMMGCPMMQRMASLDQRVRRLEERAGTPAAAQQQPGGAPAPTTR